MDCQLKNCNKWSSCNILGQCIHTHELVKDNPQAQAALQAGLGVSKAVRILQRYTPHRMILMKRGDYRNPLVLPYSTEELVKVDKLIKIGPVPKIRKRAKSIVIPIQHDSVTIEMYQNRMKALGYIAYGNLHEPKNFHE